MNHNHNSAPRHLRPTAVALAIAACFTAPGAMADASVGTPFDIVASSPSFNGEPLAVARNDAGQFVVVWDKGVLSGGIFAGEEIDVFDSDHMLTAQISLPHDGLRVDAVAIDDTGDFVVVGKTAVSGVDHIQAQRYSAAGVAQGAAIDVADTTALRYVADNAKKPYYKVSPVAVAMDGDGDFTLAWAQTTADLRAGSLSTTYCGSYIPLCSMTNLTQNTVYARAYTADGNAAGDVVKAYASPNVLTSWFDVLGYSSGLGPAAMLAPSVAMNGSRDFVLAFDQPGYYEKVYAQIHAADGTLQSQKLVALLKAPTRSTTTTQVDFRAVTTTAVSEDADGNFIVGWRQPGAFRAATTQPGTGFTIQRYTAKGRKSGAAIALPVTDEIASPHLALADDGSFVATWSDEFLSGSQTAGGAGQRYNADGSPDGPAFPLATASNSSAHVSNVLTTSSAAGNGVAVWEEFIPDGTGAGSIAIEGQTFSAQ